MNRRPLKSSEKVLLVLCGGVIALVGVVFLVRDHRLRLAAAKERIETLEPQLQAATAAAADAPFWDERETWLNATLPALPDAGEAHGRFLEHLQATARERGLTVASPVLLKPEAAAHHRALPVTLQLTGPDQALYRWLADLQSPEKFQLVRYLQLKPESAQPPRMSATVTVARLYKP